MTTDYFAIEKPIVIISLEVLYVGFVKDYKICWVG